MLHAPPCRWWRWLVLVLLDFNWDRLDRSFVVNRKKPETLCSRAIRKIVEKMWHVNYCSVSVVLRSDLRQHLPLQHMPQFTEFTDVVGFPSKFGSWHTFSWHIWEREAPSWNFEQTDNPQRVGRHHLTRQRWPIWSAGNLSKFSWALRNCHISHIKSLLAQRPNSQRAANRERNGKEFQGIIWACKNI